MTHSSSDAVALIMREEGMVGHPYWPGGLSGVTLDPGYDLGRHSLNTFRHDWQGLPSSDMAALEVAIGVRGTGASLLLDAQHLRAIPIPRELALTAFAQDSLPADEHELEVAMPGADELPPDAFGALTDLIYNRGPAMLDGPPPDPRRAEMRTIRQEVALYAGTTDVTRRPAILESIAAELDAMGDRLWPGASPYDTDLRNRRHHEAALVRRAAAHLGDST